jgi:hypothetical protein
VAGFTGVEVSSGIGLEVRQGDRYALSIRADENVLRHIRVEKRRSILRIYVEPGVSINSRGMSASITLPRLEELGLSGGSQATMAMDLGRSRFTAELSGGAELRGTLRADEAVLTASGGASVTLEGTAVKLELDGSGGSRFFLEDLAARDARVC